VRDLDGLHGLSRYWLGFEQSINQLESIQEVVISNLTIEEHFYCSLFKQDLVNFKTLVDGI
jgi:hypothetical protein